MRTIWLRHLGSAANGLAGGGIPVIGTADQRYCGRASLRAPRNRYRRDPCGPAASMLA